MSTFDHWSLLHVALGNLMGFFLSPATPIWDAAGLVSSHWLKWYAGVLGFHIVSECFENSLPGIAWLRKRAARVGFEDYEGDVVVNTLGDNLAFTAGYLWYAVVPSAAAAGAIGLLAAAVFVLRHLETDSKNVPQESGRRPPPQPPPPIASSTTLLPAPKAVYIVALPPSLERTFVQQWSETKTLARVLPPPDPSCWSACVIA